MLEGLLPLLPHKNSFIHHTCVSLKQNFKNTIIMKTKLLFFFLLTMLLQVSVDTFAMGLATRQSIKLKSKGMQDSHRSIPLLPTAYIDGSLLSVDFPVVASSATITVKNS